MATYNKNTTKAEFGANNAAVGELQTYLNTKGANLKVDNMYGPLTQAAVAKYGTPTPVNSNVSSISNPTPATDLKPSPKINLPSPETPAVLDSFTTSLASNADTIRKNLESGYKTKLESLAKEKERYIAEEKSITEKMNPAERSTYTQEQRIQGNQLQAAESASATLEADFAKRRKLTSELEHLLNQSNSLIEQEKGLPVSQRVINSRTSNTLSDISARTGVIEAVFSALDGNISQAHNIINQAKDTVAVSWKDNLNYYGTLLDLNSKGLLDIDNESKDIAEKQMQLLESDLAKVDETTEYLKKIMIDPDSAQFVADAGVKLTDSVQEIATKLAAQSQVQQINDTKNEMVKDGYTYVPFPTSTTGLVPITVGDTTMYFKPKAEKKTGGTKTEPGSVKLLSPTKRASLLSIGMNLEEINNLESDVATYGLEEALKGIEDEATKATIREAYEAEEPASAEDAETYIRDNLDIKELKKLADWAKVSKWWRGKKGDVKAFFDVANEEQLAQIKTALEEGYGIDEIIAFLNEE